MALKLDLVRKGFTTTYHKITRLMFDAVKNVTTVDFSSYKDKAARDANVLNFVATETRAFAGDLDRSGAYEALKESKKDENGHETNQWAHAVDC